MSVLTQAFVGVVLVPTLWARIHVPVTRDIQSTERPVQVMVKHDLFNWPLSWTNDYYFQ